MDNSDVKVIQERFRIIGREKELEFALAAVRAKRHVFFEGVVGVGKTVIAVAIAKHTNRIFFRVDGDERYTGHKLVGWFDPALAIAKGYSWKTFIPGPLTQAMVEGGFLFINELNRMPEGTQNVLLPAMDERQIIIPKIGVIKAKPEFLIIATQNPEEFVGTSRLGEALRDRFVWIRLDYQSEGEEREIVKKETGCDRDDLVRVAVKIGRRTRGHPDIRRGASIRAAIDLVALIQQSYKNPSSTLDLDTWSEAAVMALATKIELRDETTQKMEDVVRKIVASVLKEKVEVVPKGPLNTDKKVDEGRKKGPSTLEQSRSRRIIKAALDNGDLGRVTLLLQRNPSPISELLCEEDIFKTMLQAVRRSKVALPSLKLLYMIQTFLDPERKKIARKILTRTILHLAAKIATSGISPTEQVNVQYKPGLEEFNLEETLENKLGKDYFDYQDIVCIENHRKKKAVSMMLDTSNSMKREKIIFAALAAGVFAYKLRGDYYSIITFSDHARLLKPIYEKPDLERLISKTLDLQSVGFTNIEEALEMGLGELNRLHLQEKQGILITDGWATAGGDPVKTAEKYPKLHVIQVPLSVGGGDSEMCKVLAKVGKGKYSYVHDFQRLPRAIMHILR